ncbi:MAG: Nramp family divalent metal transporter [Psittacicella sp.]
MSNKLSEISAINIGGNEKTKRMSLKQTLLFLGPAFVISIGYIDPGNYATNIQAGSLYGYNLLWVGLSAALIAMFIQYLSAKLGIVSGKNLTEHVGSSIKSKKLVYLYWMQAEVIIMATDLAEFIGSSIGFKILFHIPLLAGMFITGVATFVILAINNSPKLSQKPLEVFTAISLLIIAGAYGLELVFAKYTHPMQLATGLFIPHLKNYSEVYFAAGVLGATVMPHVIYLHSGLFQRYKNIDTKRHLRITKQDIILALSVAIFANLAMIIMSATVFYYTGHRTVSTIYTAYETLIPTLGKFAAVIFAVSLITSGISSSVVATLAGDMVMKGFTNKSISIFLRRLLTVIPSFLVVIFAINTTFILVLSQVILSFGIVFALVPLLMLTSNKEVMGKFVNPRYIKYIGWSIVGIVGLLNVYLVVTTV